jgi:Domain of unknown function (DUF4145)
MNKTVWDRPENIPSKNFTCGHCGREIASEKGFGGNMNGNSNYREHIYICHLCSRPTFIGYQGEQIPDIKFGGDVEDISDSMVFQLYDEARNSMSVSSYTASVLCCRKLLMNIAVHKGAKEGLKFIQYVEFLSNNHYVPPDAKEWVDHIRKKGNEATHEIAIMKREDAEEIISFVEMILRLVYEFPAKIKRKTSLTPITK